MATRNSDIVARLTLNAEAFSAAHGEAFSKFAAAAQKAGTDAKATLTGAFAEIANSAKAALEMPDLNGSLNLNSAALKATADGARQQAVALREVAEAANRAALAQGEASTEAIAYANASAILATRAEENADSLQRQVVALDRIQSELGATSVSMVKHTSASAAQRAGMQQLGAQFQDLGVQISMAANSANVMAGVMSALAMQGPQVVSAISLMRGSAGGLIGFLSGPWGAAFMAATSVAAILGTQLLSTGDDAEKAAGKIDRLKAAIDALNESRADVQQIGAVEKKLNDLRDQRMSLSAPRAKDWESDEEYRRRVNATRRARGESQDSYNRRQAAALAPIEAQIRDLETKVRLNEAAEQARIDAADYRAKQNASARTPRSSSSSSRSSTGPTDAERALKAQQQAEDRLRESLEETIQRQQDSEQLTALRAKGLDREADIQEAVLNLQRQFPGLQLADSKAAAEALGIREEMVPVFRELLQLAEARKVAEVNRDYDAAAVKKRLDMEKAAQEELDRLREQSAERQRRTMEDLGRYYFDLFSGRGGDIWRDFKNEGLEVISLLAAQWTIAMMTGQKFDPVNAFGGSGGGLTGYAGPATTLFNSLMGGRGGKSLADLAASEGGSAAEIAGAADLTKGLDKMGGQLTGLNKYLAGVGAGQAVSSLAGTIGVKQNSGGAMVGSLIGTATPLGPLGGAIGGLVGGTLGGVLGGVLNPSRSAGATITGVDSVSVGGKDRKQYGVATSLSDSVIGGLQDIAEQLGGTVGSFRTTIGVRDGDYRVNTDGDSLKIKNGAIEFDDDAEGAIAYAIADAISDGAIQGLSAASQRILQAGAADDLSAAIQKASLIEAIPKALQARLDPVAYAIDTLNDKWDATWDALAEGAATAEQMADAQKLYNMELEEVKNATASAAKGLKDFIADMNFGSSSPLSLRDQEKAAQEALAPYLAQIDRGESINQDAYMQAAQSWLNIERQLYGSTSKYFEAFDQIQAATSEAIASIENVSSISTASDAANAVTATATQETAANTSNIATLLEQATALLREIAGQGGGSSGADRYNFIGTTRNF